MIPLATTVHAKVVPVTVFGLEIAMAVDWELHIAWLDGVVNSVGFGLTVTVCVADVGDVHPLYFDEEYARNSRYGGLIAPPSIHVMLMFACTPTDDWMRSPGTINAGQSWSYNIPARPGDTITMQARALDKFIRKDRLFVVHDNVFFNQQGQVICSGRGQTIRPM